MWPSPVASRTFVTVYHGAVEVQILLMFSASKTMIGEVQPLYKWIFPYI